MPESPDLLTAFGDLDDPRVTGRCDHKLIDVLAIAVCAVISGADDFTEMQLFGEARKEWFATWLELPHGIPSHDTFGRVLGMIDPDAFAECFASWMRAALEATGGEIVCVDGKTLRGSAASAEGAAPVHMVSAWAHANGVVLGQLSTDGKSNEITAVPELLSRLDLAGCIVTLDAMGCQKEIAGRIVEGDGDYVIVLKDNQKGLKAEAVAALDEILGGEYDDCRTAHVRTVDDGHGRHEVRDYWLVDDMRTGGRKDEWAGLQCFGKVTSRRTVRGETSEETRYFITSLPCKVKAFAEAARAHWSIENSLHWSLDVSFREDACRVRNRHAAENLSTLRRTALTALKRTEIPKRKRGVKGKRLFAAWDHDYLLQVLENI